MARRKRFESARPMAPTARGKKRCGEVTGRTDDGHVQRCKARPHDETERHNPGPWEYEQEQAA